jgi:ABC-type lipoprotein release transport system permease subunit
MRLAIGAEPRAIRLLVLFQGLRVVGVGLVFGLAAALVVTRLLSSLLFQVSPTDPMTLIVASILLLTVAAAASDLPARRGPGRSGSGPSSELKSSDAEAEVPRTLRPSYHLGAGK